MLTSSNERYSNREIIEAEYLVDVKHGNNPQPKIDLEKTLQQHHTHREKEKEKRERERDGDERLTCPLRMEVSFRLCFRSCSLVLLKVTESRNSDVVVHALYRFF